MRKNSGYKTREEHLELLVESRDFRKSVSAFRKKWRIPKNGLSEKVANHWWDTILQESDRAIEKAPNPNESADIPLESFHAEIDDLEKKFEIQPIDRGTFKRYLLYNKIYWLPAANARLFYKRNKDTKKKEIFIEIYSGTTLKDIELLWSIVKKLQKQAEGYMPGRRRAIANFEMTQQVLRLRRQGLSSKEIADTIKGQYPGKAITYSDINKILHKAKKKTHSR